MNKALARPKPKPKAPQPDQDKSDRTDQSASPSQLDRPRVVIECDGKPRSDDKAKAPQPDQDKSDRPHEPIGRSGKPRTFITFQSIAMFAGRLHVEGDRLKFRCPDGILLPVVGIDPAFSLWLLSRPGELFSPDDRQWLVYPKSDRQGRLTVALKSLCSGDRVPPLPIDTARVAGKLLAADGEKMTIGIRRNLSHAAFKELSAKRMIQNAQLGQFTVIVWGKPPSEVGTVVDLECRRDGDRLVRSDLDQPVG